MMTLIHGPLLSLYLLQHRTFRISPLQASSKQRLNEEYGKSRTDILLSELFRLLSLQTSVD